jgi:tetratricopeptide (TPR) repeat protein
LARDYPEASLALIDEFFALGDHFDLPTARCVQAEAFVSLGRISDALAALKLALEWEAEHPRMLSTASIDYPLMVARYRIVEEYGDALMVLVDRFKPSDFSFPATRYRWNGCQALIRAELGQADDARHFAERALVAASATQSPFRYHRTVGLVSQTSDDFGLRVKRIARPSALRKLLRVIAGGKVS